MPSKNNRLNNSGKSDRSSIWGGRFASGPGQIMEKINTSISFDKRLYKQDITASKAHSNMLVDQGIISKEDGAAIGDGLDTVLAEIENGAFNFSNSLLDGSF